MLQYKDNKVFLNGEELGGIDTVKVVESTLTFTNNTGEQIFIHESILTPSEREIYDAWLQKHKDDPTEASERIIITEPADEEKVAMAEAIIDLEARITVLEGRV